jgi:hypothetical protein
LPESARPGFLCWRSGNDHACVPASPDGRKLGNRRIPFRVWWEPPASAGGAGLQSSESAFHLSRMGFTGCGKGHVATLSIQLTEFKVCSNPQLVIPPARRAVRPNPDFLYADLRDVACAAFIEESRMGCINATKLHRKSGGMGHPSSVANARESPGANRLRRGRSYPSNA